MYTEALIKRNKKHSIYTEGKYFNEIETELKYRNHMLSIEFSYIPVFHLFFDSIIHFL